MPFERKIHWRAPTIISLSYFGACAFAVAHHLYNTQLAGTVVSSYVYHVGQLQFTGQMVSIAVAFAFATLFHVCLAVAISAAYTQCFWHTMANTNTGTHMATLDHLNSVLQSIWSLFRVKLWWRYPALLLLALISWTIPIASIIAPATLTIKSAPSTPAYVTAMDVPRVDFRSLKFLATPQVSYNLDVAADDFGPWQNNVSVYNGPSYMAERVALSVAAQGSILPIQPSSTNSSWTIDTHMPALRCNAVNDTLRQAMQQNIIGAYWNGTGCATPYNFLSWTANPGVVVGPAAVNTRGYTQMNSLPFNGPANVSAIGYGTWPINMGTIGPLDWSAVGPHGYSNATQVATIYFAAIPGLTFDTPGNCRDRALSFEWTNSTFLQCELHNTTYRADFGYVNGVQNISLQTRDDVASNPVSTLVGFDVAQANTSCPTLNADFKSCSADPEVLERLSYQAIMDSFGRIFAGSVAQLRFGRMATDRTNIMHSVLLDTPELAFLAQSGQWVTDNANAANDSIQALYGTRRKSANITLSNALESLFQNITLSMMSVPQFRPDPASMFAPSRVNVTQEIYQNVYEYSASKLWIAYGCALIAAAFASIAGFVVMFMAGVSYSNNFSSIFRASRSARISENIKAGDVEGNDPLPSYLAKAKVAFAFANKDVLFRPGIVRRISSGDVESGSMKLSGKKAVVHVRTLAVGTNSF